MRLRAVVPSGQWPSLTRADEADPSTTMRHVMETMFEDLTRGSPAAGAIGRNVLTPNVNVVENAKGLEISAELPGVDQKNIEIDLADGILTLKAERQDQREERDEKAHYHIVERSYGTLLRRFALPFEADAQKVEASLDRGVLHISVPRQEPVEKPKTKIAIKGEAKN